MCKNGRRLNYTRQTEFDKNRAINGTGSVASILQYWDWFIAALTIRMTGASSQRRKAERKEERNVRSHLVEGPLFSTRVHNLASSRQRARGKKRRTHYLCLSAFMDVGDKQFALYTEVSSFRSLRLFYLTSLLSSFDRSAVSRSAGMRFRSVARSNRHVFSLRWRVSRKIQAL